MGLFGKKDPAKASENEFDDDFMSDLDNMDSDLSGFDLDGEDIDSEKERGPAGPIASIADTIGHVGRSAAGGAAMSIATKVGGALPGTKQAINDATNIASDFIRMKNDVVKDMRPVINQGKIVTRQLMKYAKDYVPNALYDKIDKALETEEDDSNPKVDKEGMRQTAMADQMAAIFKHQAATAKVDRQQAAIERMVDMKMEQSRHKETGGLLIDIRNQQYFQTQFIRSTYTAYLKKDLELKYRRLYLAEDTLELLRITAEMQEKRLDAIRHNTALPDSQKIKLTEVAKQKTREKIVGGAQKFVWDYFGNIRKNIKEQWIDPAMDAMKGLVDGGAMLADMMEMGDEMGMGGKKRSLLGKAMGWAGKLGGGALGSKLSEKTIQKIPIELRKTISEYAQMGQPGLVMLLDKIRSGKLEFKGSEGLKGFLEAVAPGMDKSQGKFENDVTKDPNAAGTITRRFTTTVEEIIPGYLAKQTALLKQIATGEKSEEEYFDMNSRSFKTKKAFQGELDRMIGGTQDDRTYALKQNVDAVKMSVNNLDHLEKDKKESFLKDIDKNAEKITLVLQNLIMKKNDDFDYNDIKFIADSTDPADAVKRNVWARDAFKGIEPKVAKQICEMFMLYMTNSDGSPNHLFAVQMQRRIRQGIMEVSDRHRASILKAMDLGYTPQLVEAGAVQVNKRGELEVSEDYLHKMWQDAAGAEQDEYETNEYGEKVKVGSHKAILGKDEQFEDRTDYSGKKEKTQFDKLAEKWKETGASEKLHWVGEKLNEGALWAARKAGKEKEYLDAIQQLKSNWDDFVTWAQTQKKAFKDWTEEQKVVACIKIHEFCVKNEMFRDLDKLLFTDDGKLREKIPDDEVMSYLNKSEKIWQASSAIMKSTEPWAWMIRMVMPESLKLLGQLDEAESIILRDNYEDGIITELLKMKPEEIKKKLLEMARNGEARKARDIAAGLQGTMDRKIQEAGPDKKYDANFQDSMKKELEERARAEGNLAAQRTQEQGLSDTIEYTNQHGITGELDLENYHLNRKGEAEELGYFAKRRRKKELAARGIPEVAPEEKKGWRERFSGAVSGVIDAGKEKLGIGKDKGKAVEGTEGTPPETDAELLQTQNEEVAEQIDTAEENINKTQALVGKLTGAMDTLSTAINKVLGPEEEGGEKKSFWDRTVSAAKGLTDTATGKVRGMLHRPGQVASDSIAGEGEHVEVVAPIDGSQQTEEILQEALDRNQAGPELREDTEAEQAQAEAQEAANDSKLFAEFREKHPEYAAAASAAVDSVNKKAAQAGKWFGDKFDQAKAYGKKKGWKFWAKGGFTDEEPQEEKSGWLSGLFKKKDPLSILKGQLSVQSKMLKELKKSGGFAKKTGGLLSGLLKFFTISGPLATLKGLGTGVAGAVGGLGKGIGHMASGLGKGIGSLIPAMGSMAGKLGKAGVDAGLWAGKKAVGAAGWAAKQTGNLLGLAKRGVTALVPPVLKGAMGLVSNTLGMGKAFMKKYVDVYRKDEIANGPIATASQLKNGKIVDHKGKPVKDSYSIKTPLYWAELPENEDKAGNIAISQEDIDHGLVDSKNKDLNRLSNKLGSMARRLLGFVAAPLTKPLGFIKRKLKEKIFGKKKDPFIDVYVPGPDGEIEVGHPRLLGAEIKAGRYVNEKGKPLTSAYAISIEPWLDKETNQVVLSEDEIKKGLLDSHGNKIEPKRGILAKIVRAATLPIRLPLNLIKGAGGKIAKMFSGVFGKSEAGQRMGQFFGNFFGKFDNLFLKRADLEEVVGNKLDRIYDLMDKRIPEPTRVAGDTDGDGDRNGSYEDQMQQRKAKQGKGEAIPLGPAGTQTVKVEREGRGFFEKLRDWKDGLMAGKGFLGKAARGIGKVGGFLGKGIGKIAGKIGLKSLLGKIGSRVGLSAAGGALASTGLGSAVGGAITATAGGAASALGMTGMAAAIASNPIGWAVGAGLLAFTAYQGIKWLMSDSDYTKEWIKERYKGYGLPEDGGDQEKAVKSLEKETLKILDKERGPLTDAEFEQYTRDFGIMGENSKWYNPLSWFSKSDAEKKDDSKQRVEFFVSWYKSRFAPVFGCYVDQVSQFTKRQPGDKVNPDDIPEEPEGTQEQVLDQFKQMVNSAVVGDARNLVPTKEGYEAWVEANKKEEKKETGEDESADDKAKKEHESAVARSMLGIEKVESDGKGGYFDPNNPDKKISKEEMDKAQHKEEGPKQDKPFWQKALAIFAPGAAMAATLAGGSGDSEDTHSGKEKVMAALAAAKEMAKGAFFTPWRAAENLAGKVKRGIRNLFTSDYVLEWEDARFELYGISDVAKAKSAVLELEEMQLKITSGNAPGLNNAEMDRFARKFGLMNEKSSWLNPLGKAVDLFNFVRGEGVGQESNKDEIMAYFNTWYEKRFVPIFKLYYVIVRAFMKEQQYIKKLDVEAIPEKDRSGVLEQFIQEGNRLITDENKYLIPTIKGYEDYVKMMQAAKSTSQDKESKGDKSVEATAAEAAGVTPKQPKKEESKQDTNWTPAKPIEGKEPEVVNKDFDFHAADARKWIRSKGILSLVSYRLLTMNKSPLALTWDKAKNIDGYGIEERNEKQLSAINDLEKRVIKAIDKKDTELNDEDIETFARRFGLMAEKSSWFNPVGKVVDWWKGTGNETNKKEIVNYFTTWYAERFRPIFEFYVQVVSSVTEREPGDMPDVDHIPEDQTEECLKSFNDKVKDITGHEDIMLLIPSIDGFSAYLEHKEGKKTKEPPVPSGKDTSEDQAQQTKAAADQKAEDAQQQMTKEQEAAADRAQNRDLMLQAEQNRRVMQAQRADAAASGSGAGVMSLYETMYNQPAVAPGSQGAGNAASGSDQYGGGEGNTSPNIDAAQKNYKPSGPTGQLGSHVARFESGKEGPFSVSWDRTGGTSYGTYQLATTPKADSMTDFLKWVRNKGAYGKKIADEMGKFPNRNTGSKRGPAVDTWKKLVAENPKAFHQLEWEFIKSRYDGALRSLGKWSKDAPGPQLVQMIKSDRGLQEAFWSTVIQHGPGGAANIFGHTWKPNITPRQWLQNIYAKRGGCFGSSTKQIQGSVQGRFKEELGIVAALSGGALAPDTFQEGGGSGTALAEAETGNMKPEPTEMAAAVNQASSNTPTPSTSDTGAAASGGDSGEAVASAPSTGGSGDTATAGAPGGDTGSSTATADASSGAGSTPTPTASSDTGAAASGSNPAPSGDTASQAVAQNTPEQGQQQQAQSGSPDKAASAAMGELTQHASINATADMSGVKPYLKQRFAMAAKDYHQATGKKIPVNSAFRSDQKQAELWVRGNILHEKGVSMPAKPSKTQQVSWKGKTYTAQGSGVPSKFGHKTGDAIDVSNGDAFEPFAKKYGLVRPWPVKDKPHFQVQDAKQRTPMGGFDGTNITDPKAMAQAPSEDVLKHNAAEQQLPSDPATASSGGSATGDSGGSTTSSNPTNQAAMDGHVAALGHAAIGAPGSSSGAMEGAGASPGADASTGGDTGSTSGEAGSSDTGGAPSVSTDTPSQTGTVGAPMGEDAKLAELKLISQILGGIREDMKGYFTGNQQSSQQPEQVPHTNPETRDAPPVAPPSQSNGQDLQQVVYTAVQQAMNDTQGNQRGAVGSTTPPSIPTIQATHSINISKKPISDFQNRPLSATA